MPSLQRSVLATETKWNSPSQIGRGFLIRLQYHIHRCLGPCVEGLTTDEAYARAVQDVRLFLEGRHRDLAAGIRDRMEDASEEMRFEEAAGLIVTYGTTYHALHDRARLRSGETVAVLGASGGVGQVTGRPLGAVTARHGRSVGWRRFP